MADQPTNQLPAGWNDGAPSGMDQNAYNQWAYKKFIDGWNKNNRGAAPSFDDWLKTAGGATNAGWNDYNATQQKNTQMQQADQWRGKLNDFYNYMNMPLSQLQQQPEVQKAMQSVQGQANKNSYLRGLDGSGLSAMTTQRAGMDTLMGIQGQRQQLGMQALGLGINDLQGMERLNEQSREFDKGMQFNYDQMNAGQNSLRGPLGLIGGVVGAVGGGIAGGPAGAVAGAGLGSKLGSFGADAIHPPSISTYNPGYGGGGSTGLGGNRSVY